MGGGGEGNSLSLATFVSALGSVITHLKAETWGVGLCWSLVTCELKRLLRHLSQGSEAIKIGFITVLGMPACQDLSGSSSVAQSCPTLCDRMDCSTPGLPVHHQLPESTQTHVHGVGDAIQPSYPLSSLSPPALSLSQHQSFPLSQDFSLVPN